MSCVFDLQIIHLLAMSNQGVVLDFGMQVLEASLSPVPSACRILKFDNVSVLIRCETSHTDVRLSFVFCQAADAVNFSQTINLVTTPDYKVIRFFVVEMNCTIVCKRFLSAQVVLPFSRRPVSDGQFLMLSTLALKREQREIWLTHPLCDKYTLKINGEVKGASLTPEDEDEDAEIHWANEEADNWIEMANYRPPTPMTP